MDNNSNNPSFPIHPGIAIPQDERYIGLTKREYFTAMCLQGILANPSPEIMQSEIALEDMAIQLADATLKKLNSK